MSEISERYRMVARQLSERVKAVPDEAWDNPAPCEGWVARDVIGHMVEWMPSLLQAGTGIELAKGPSVDDDPVGAWESLHDSLQALLDDPETSAREFYYEKAGRHSLEDAVAMFFTGDVFLHTWDLARATGGDERLDPDEVHRMLVGMEPLDAMLRASGQYGPRVEVPSDADEQTRLLAFIGRTP